MWLILLVLVSTIALFLLIIYITDLSVVIIIDITMITNIVIIHIVIFHFYCSCYNHYQYYYCYCFYFSELFLCYLFIFIYFLFINFIWICKYSITAMQLKQLICRIYRYKIISDFVCLLFIIILNLVKEKVSEHGCTTVVYFQLYWQSF